MDELVLRKGEVVVCEGESGSSFYVVESGQLTITVGEIYAVIWTPAALTFGCVFAITISAH
jgi:hypothetical protein